MSARGTDRLSASAVRMDASKNKIEASRFKCHVYAVFHICHLDEAIL